MENQEKKKIEDIIKETVREMLEKMGFKGEIELKVISDGEKENIVCNIKTSDSSFLIGQYGVNLQAIQHIARLLVRKKTDDKVNFIIDVNSYREDKNSSIVQLAKDMAEQAVREKRAVVLRPMSPYERRIIHMELAKNSQVKTESIGEGEDRKIVIKPAEDL